MLMTNKDKHFIEYWEEQREGPKWQYYLQYVFAWTLAIFLGIFFLLKIILDSYAVGSMTTLYIIAPASVVVGIILTHLIYTRNEKRYRKLVEANI